MPGGAIASCPICASDAPVVVCRDGVPVHQHLIFASAEEARGATRGDLAIACCESCDFVFNSAFDDSKLAYGGLYENAQTHSPSFQQHLHALIAELASDERVAGGHVIEIGCGAGTFLRMLAKAAGHGMSGEGFDPAYRGPHEEGNLRFVPEFYDAESGMRPATAVISRHVIEHIGEPVTFLRSAGEALGAPDRGQPEPRVYLETPCVEWILERGAIWDFFYEHCSYFSPTSLAHACARAGLEATEIRHVFGGQYLWAVAVPATGEQSPPPAGSLLDKARAFARCWEVHEERIRGLVAGAPGGGEVLFWGAGAKAVTVANLIDPDRELVDAVIDVNPRKQGSWLAGTGHPIVAPQRLDSVQGGRVVVMNSNYLGEIGEAAERAGWDVDLVELEKENA